MLRNASAKDRDMTGDALLQVLATLANPHRIRVVAALAEERNYVSQLARDLGISRALLQVHLRKLEAAGLVSASIEVSADGKAMKFYEVAPFALHLTPETVRAAARTLSTESDLEAELRCSHAARSAVAGSYGKGLVSQAAGATLTSKVRVSASVS
jgi:DNA-binding transcriptional ArsR family regulator